MSDTEFPLQMPVGYDFNQRKVDWKSYDKDFLLRTDAVWEKSKLYNYFHTLYKAVIVKTYLRVEYSKTECIILSQ
jgi:cytochrome bd-type quinol oxidase subunit 1